MVINEHSSRPGEPQLGLSESIHAAIESSAPFIGGAALLSSDLENSTETVSLPRPEELDNVAEAYHLHGMLEATDQNDPRVEHNLDQSLLLTWMIRNQTAPTSIADGARDNPDSVFGWITNKYPASQVTERAFQGSAANVVSQWYGILGPHNDMTDAYQDLVSALNWVDAQFSDGKQRPTATETILMVDLATEIAEQSETTLGDKIAYLERSVEILEKSELELKSQGDIQKLCAVQARKCQTLIGLQKQRTFLMDDVVALKAAREADPNYDAKYTEFAVEASATIENFEQEIVKNVDVVTASSSEPVRQDGQIGSIGGKIFEAFTFATLLRKSVEQGALDTTRVRQATLREDMGMGHNVKFNPSNQQETSLNGNFDIRVDTATEDYKTRSTYVQLKAKTPSSRVQLPHLLNERYLNGKEFVILTLTDTVEGLEEDNANPTSWIERLKQIREALTKSKTN